VKTDRVTQKNVKPNFFYKQQSLCSTGVSSPKVTMDLTANVICPARGSVKNKSS